MGPWHSCPLPGPGAAGETSFWPPSLSSCEERGEPLPILVAVAGLLSSPVSYLIPILALEPRIPALYSQGAQDSKYGWVQNYFCPQFLPQHPPSSPHKTLSLSPCFRSLNQLWILWPTTTPQPRRLSRSPRLAYSKRHHNIGFY